MNERERIAILRKLFFFACKDSAVSFQAKSLDFEMFQFCCSHADDFRALVEDYIEVKGVPRAMIFEIGNIERIVNIPIISLAVNLGMVLGILYITGNDRKKKYQDEENERLKSIGLGKILDDLEKQNGNSEK